MLFNKTIKTKRGRWIESVAPICERRQRHDRHKADH